MKQWLETTTYLDYSGYQCQNVEVQLYIIVLRALAFNASTSAKAIYSTFILGSYYFK